MRCFHLDRRHDSTGVSGTGIVAEGVQFADGTVVLRWTAVVTSTVIYNSIDDVEKIHGHGGNTLIVWGRDG